MQLGIDFIKDVVSEVECLHATFPQEVQFSIDSRTLKKGDIFVALRGKAVDGHDFIEQALVRGAGGLVLALEHRHILDAIDKDILKRLQRRSWGMP